MEQSHHDKALEAAQRTEDVFFHKIHVTEQRAQQMVTKSEQAAHMLAHCLGKQANELDNQSHSHQVRQRMIEEVHATAREMIRFSHGTARVLLAEAHTTARAINNCSQDALRAAEQSSPEMASGVQGDDTAHRQPFADSKTQCFGEDEHIEHKSVHLWSACPTESDGVVIVTPSSSACSSEDGSIVAAALSKDSSDGAVDEKLEVEQEHESTPTIKKPAAKDEKHDKTSSHTNNPTIMLAIGGHLVTIYGKAFLNGKAISKDFRDPDTGFDVEDQVTILNISGEVLTIHGRFLFDGQEVRCDDEKNSDLDTKTKVPLEEKSVVDTCSPKYITIGKGTEQVEVDSACAALKADGQGSCPPHAFVQTECVNGHESELDDIVKPTAVASDSASGPEQYSPELKASQNSVEEHGTAEQGPASAPVIRYAVWFSFPSEEHIPWTDYTKHPTTFGDMDSANTFAKELLDAFVGPSSEGHEGFVWNRRNNEFLGSVITNDGNMYVVVEQVPISFDGEEYQVEEPVDFPWESCYYF